VKKETPGIQIKVNEKEVFVPSDTTLFQLKHDYRPNADLIIYNGFPLASNSPVKEAMKCALSKGEKPTSRNLNA